MFRERRGKTSRVALQGSGDKLYPRKGLKFDSRDHITSLSGHSSPSMTSPHLTSHVFFRVDII